MIRGENLKRDDLYIAMNQLADTLEIAKIGIWEWSLVSGEVTFSKEALKIIGYDVSLNFKTTCLI